MRIELRREGGRPVYLQIADAIRAQVEEGRLGAGARLPPIRALARQLGVNRDTVAQAYAELAGAGWVESTVGRGTFVRRGSAAAAPGRPAEPPIAAAAERVVGFEASQPRFAVGPDAVQMHSVVPDHTLYPAEAFRRTLNRVLTEGGAALLLYGGPQGHAGLRDVLAERLRRAQVPADPDELVLCHGASQGIALALRVFAAPGDAVAVEEPTYHNVLGMLLALGLRPVPVPMREGGPDLEALERALARPEVKLLYTIPTFHNPMGTTSSLAHRRSLLDIAARSGKPVLEDAFEMDLRYAGRPVPPLAALDGSGLVVHLFSFSKSLFPGVRVGSILARGRAVPALLALKRATDLSDAMPLQAALAEFVRSGAYDRHVAGLRRILRARRDALLAALGEELPAGSRWTTPEGGYQVWVELPDGIDTADLLAEAAPRGLLFAPGYQFHCGGRRTSALRLTVAMADEAAIRRGVAILGELARERLRDARSLPAAAAVQL